MGHGGQQTMVPDHEIPMFGKKDFLSRQNGMGTMPNTEEDDDYGSTQAQQGRVSHVGASKTPWGLGRWPA